MIMTIPKNLYHATTEEAAIKIKDGGLKPSEWEQSIYLTEFKEDAVKFGQFYASTRAKNYKEVLENLDKLSSLTKEEIAEGKFKPVEAIPNTNFIVFEIDTTHLRPAKFMISDDHNSEYWNLKGECYIYYKGKIPPSMLTNAWEYKLK